MSARRVQYSSSRVVMGIVSEKKGRAMERTREGYLWSSLGCQFTRLIMPIRKPSNASRRAGYSFPILTSNRTNWSMTEVIYRVLYSDSPSMTRPWQPAISARPSPNHRLGFLGTVASVRSAETKRSALTYRRRKIWYRVWYSLWRNRHGAVSGVEGPYVAHPSAFVQFCTMPMHTAQVL
jgi:hypothetical protein